MSNSAHDAGSVLTDVRPRPNTVPISIPDWDDTAGGVQTIPLQWVPFVGMPLPHLRIPAAWSDPAFGQIEIPQVGRSHHQMMCTVATPNRWSEGTHLPVIVDGDAFEQWRHTATAADLLTCIQHPYQFAILWGTHEYLAYAAGLTARGHHEARFSWRGGHHHEHLRTAILPDPLPFPTPTSPTEAHAPSQSHSVRPLVPRLSLDEHDPGFHAEQYRLIGWLRSSTSLSPGLLLAICGRIHPSHWGDAFSAIQDSLRMTDLSSPHAVPLIQSLCVFVSIVLQHPDSISPNGVLLHKIDGAFRLTGLLELLSQTDASPQQIVWENLWLDLLSGTPSTRWPPEITAWWASRHARDGKAALVARLCLGRDATRVERTQQCLHTWRQLPSASASVMLSAVEWQTFTQHRRVSLPSDLVRRAVAAWPRLDPRSQLRLHAAGVTAHFLAPDVVGRWRHLLLSASLGTPDALGPSTGTPLDELSIEPPQSLSAVDDPYRLLGTPDVLTWSLAFGRSLADVSPRRGATVLRRHLARLHGAGALTLLLKEPVLCDILGWTLASLPPATLAALGRPLLTTLLQHPDKNWRIFWIQRLAQVSTFRQATLTGLRANESEPVVRTLEEAAPQERPSPSLIPPAQLSPARRTSTTRITGPR